MCKDVARSVALLFASGQEEFVSKAIRDYSRVYVLLCDNGCALGMSAAVEEVKHLEAEFGQDKVIFAGVQNISSALYRFQYDISYHTIQESASRYPFLKPVCLCCMACQVAAFIELIAFCKANEIDTAAMNKEGLISKLPELVNELVVLAKDCGITLEFIGCHGESLDELQCLLRQDPISALSMQQRKSLMLYFKTKMRSYVAQRLSQRISMMSVTKTALGIEPMHS